MLTNVKKTFSPKPAILAQAMEGRQATWNIFLNGLAAFGVGIGSIFSEAVLLIPYYVVAGIISVSAGIAVSPEASTIAQLFVTVAPPSPALMFL